MAHTSATDGHVAGDAPRSRRVRRDFLASRQDLLEAAERLLAKQGRRFSLVDLAAEAGVATATAYRHFPDVDAVLDAFYAQLIERLVRRMDALRPGPPALSHFSAVCDLWVAEAATWGAAAVHIRSSRGFLERLQAQDPLIRRLFDALVPLITRLADERSIPDVTHEYAVLIWVTIFDERVIVDLHDALGWSVEEISGKLTGSVLRALGYQPANGDRGHRR
jgi:AcrR family transcriptional regulator